VLAVNLIVRQPDLALAAFEQRLEHGPEMVPDGAEGLDEHGAGGLVDLAHRLEQRVARVYQVVALAGEELQALDLLGVFLHGEGVDRPQRLDRLGQPFGFLLKGLGVAGDVGRAGEELVNGFVPLAFHPLHHGSTPGGGLGLPELEAVGLFAELEHLRPARFHRGLGCAERLLGLAHPGLRLLRGRLELLHLHPSLGQLVGPLGPLLRQRRGLGGDLGQLGFEPADGRFRLRQPLRRPALPLARRVLPRRHLGFLHLPVYPALARGLLLRFEVGQA